MNCQKGVVERIRVRNGVSGCMHGIKQKSKAHVFALALTLTLIVVAGGITHHCVRHSLPLTTEYLSKVVAKAGSSS